MSEPPPGGPPEASAVTRDGFLNGAVTVLQPADGYRAGMDAALSGTLALLVAGRALQLVIY